ncbi:hypothetical protein EHQ96_00130 [Leptospira levettii]|uniref:hypothetical protein n=1 Tax=Leptospira levettii TaxID=2023178 RepID=UPI0010836D4D|nr:hypothetical protein [Leptospira levettii]TGM73611.1 hypothetical protein EHQ96_00130 [Leptospira levettii]
MLIAEFLSCFTFNQTRNISRKNRGVNELKIDKIIKVERKSQTEITIWTLSSWKDGSSTEEPMCISVYHDSSFEKYIFSLYTSNIVKMEKCKSSVEAQPLNFIVTSEYLYYENKKIHKENASKIKSNSDLEENSLMIPLEYKLLFVENKLILKNQFSKYYSNKEKFVYANPTNLYYPLYPFAFTYDIFAGTLHTLGTPFYYVCESYAFIGLKNSPLNFFEKALSLGVLFTACPIGALLIIPDGFKVNPDIIEN